MEKRFTGTVKWFNKKKGYGFITPDADQKLDDGSKLSSDVFVHWKSIISNAKFKRLSDGQRVTFELSVLEDGRSAASNVTAIKE